MPLKLVSKVCTHSVYWLQKTFLLTSCSLSPAKPANALPDGFMLRCWGNVRQKIISQRRQVGTHCVGVEVYPENPYAPGKHKVRSKHVGYLFAIRQQSESTPSSWTCESAHVIKTTAGGQTEMTDCGNLILWSTARGYMHSNSGRIWHTGASLKGVVRGETATVGTSIGSSSIAAGFARQLILSSFN